MPEERRVCAPQEVAAGQLPPAGCAVLESMCRRVWAPAHMYGCPRALCE